MRVLRRLLLADSIFSRTLLLVLATTLLLTAVNILIIFAAAPPISAPLTAYELARVVEGKPIAKTGQFSVVLANVPPPAAIKTGENDLFASAVARFLHARPSDVRINRQNLPPRGEIDVDAITAREARLYAGEGQFNPVRFGAFVVAVRQHDGQWSVASSSPKGRDPQKMWQSRTALRLLLSLLVIVPIAWLFSSRIARPIRAFADAAERLGHRRQMEPVDVKGPAEIRQAAKAMNDMLERLQVYLAERTSMVGAIAHDLRAPLSRLNFHMAAAPAPVRTKAESEIREMEELIAAILDFVQNEGRTRAQDVLDLRLLVEGVVDDFADLGHDVMLVESDRATMVGDPALLKRLFANLVSNAIAYGKCARVSLQVEDRNAVVAINDFGPGLPEEELERVFTPFYRTESSRNRATGGMGLGLAIVKAVAETHGGSVRLVNRTSGGLCAEVVLPLE